MADTNGIHNEGSAGAPDLHELDVHREPGYQDNDAHFNNMVDANSAVPQEVHADDQEKMEKTRAELNETLKDPDNLKLLGEGPGVGIIVDNSRVNEELKKLDPNMNIDDALKEAGQTAIAKAIDDATKSAQAADFNGDGSKQSGEQGGKAGAQKPMDLEQTLASIRMSASRDQRFVVSGDPRIEKAFFIELEARGKMRYQGGVPVINVSAEKAKEILQQVCEREGVKMQTAMKLEFDRTGNGGLSDVAAGLKNMIGRRNSVEVFVVGDQATIDKKLENISELLNKMAAAKFLSDGDKALVTDGKLDLKKGPAEFQATRSMQELVTMATNTVGDYQRQQAAQDALRMEFRNKQVDGQMAKAAAESGGADAGAGGKADVQANPPSKYIASLQKSVNDASNISEGLTKKDGKQIVAEVLLNKVRSLKDSDLPEIAKLSTEQRQVMLTQLAVMVAKADAGSLGKDFTSEKIDRTYEANPEKDKPASGSIREKVAELIAAEKAHDPKFEENAVQLLANMKSAGTIGQEHLEKAAAALAPGREIPPPSKDVYDAAQDAIEKATARPVDAPASEATLQAAATASKDMSQASEKSAGATRDGGSTEAGSEVKNDASAVAEKAPAQTTPAQGTLPFAADSTEAAGKAPVADAGTTAATAANQQSPAEGKASTAGAPAQPADAASAPAAPAATGADVKAPTADAPTTTSQAIPTEGKAAGTDAPAPAADASAVKPAAAASEKAASAPEVPVAVAEKTNPLVDKLEAVVKAGPAALTREDASALLASLDGRQTAKLASLDGRSGTAPTETLVRIEGVLNEVAKGKLGDDLAATAKDLGGALEKWKQQDVDRVMTSYDVSHADIAAKAGQLRAADSAWHAAAGQAGQATDNTRADAGAKTPSAESGEAARLAAGERYTQTEMAAGKLASLMANPAGSFTNRDKTWNERGVDSAVDAIMRIDVESSKQMSQNQRNTVAAYSAWMADAANSGKLPGFDGPDGKARADALTQKTVQLIAGANGSQSAAATSQLGKAERMVSAMGQRTRGVSRGTTTTRVAAATPATASRTAAPKLPAADVGKLAKDIGNAVYKSTELTESNAKFMLKNSDMLSADSMKALSPQDKAQAAVGLAYLAAEVRAGAMGDFKTLAPAVQQMVVKAEDVATRLHTELAGDKTTVAALAQAHRDLPGNEPATGKAAAGTVGKDATSEAGGKAAEQSLEKTTSGNSGGRSLER